MSYEEIATEIMEKIDYFDMALPFPPYERERFVVLVPESEYKTLIKGSGIIDIETLNGELTVYGIKVRKSKEQKIIVGVE